MKGAAVEQTKSADVDFVLFMLWLEFATASLLVLGVIAFQLYAWLRTGAWEPISVVTLLAFVGLEWAISPNDWLGVHRILNFIPLSLTFFVLALPSGMFLFLFYRER